MPAAGIRAMWGMGGLSVGVVWDGFMRALRQPEKDVFVYAGGLGFQAALMVGGWAMLWRVFLLYVQGSLKLCSNGGYYAGVQGLAPARGRRRNACASKK